LQFSIILHIKNIAINSSSSSTYSVMKELEDLTNQHWFKCFQEAKANPTHIVSSFIVWLSQAG
jgi:hypothetical protein